MNGICPNCGKEMEKGYLQTSGNNIIWDTKTHGLLIRPSKEGKTLAYHPLGAAYLENVYRCRSCRLILFRHSEFA